MIIAVFTATDTYDKLFPERVTEMESTGKGAAEINGLEEGLRILARMIARAYMSEAEHDSESKQEDSDVIGK